MSRINEIAEAVATYVNAHRVQLAALVASVRADPVTYHATETDVGPRVWIYPMETVNTRDTREAWRTDYKIGITSTAAVVSGNVEKLELLQDLTESIRQLIKDQDLGDAVFMTIGEESAIPEFDLQQEMVGQYFVSTFTAEYADFS